jgi:signal transduction histidine kinase
LEFARPGAADFSATDVREVMDATVSFVTNRCYKQNIEVITQLEDNLLRIYADPQQVEQVLMNLYLNSIDAMPDGGRLTIEAKDARDGILITVTDTGFGIEDNDLTKIFQPFLLRRRKAVWDWAFRLAIGSFRITAAGSR